MNRNIEFLLMPNEAYQVLKSKGVNTTLELERLDRRTLRKLVEETKLSNSDIRAIQKAHWTVLTESVASQFDKSQIEKENVTSQFDKSPVDVGVKDTTVLLGLFPELEEYEHYTVTLDIEEVNKGKTTYTEEYFLSIIVQKLTSSNIKTLRQLINLKLSEVNEIFDGDYGLVSTFLTSVSKHISYKTVWPNKDRFAGIAEMMKAHLDIAPASNYIELLYNKQAFKAIKEVCEEDEINNMADLLPAYIWGMNGFIDDCINTEAMRIWLCEYILEFITEECEERDESFINTFELETHFSNVIKAIGKESFDDIIEFLAEQNAIAKHDEVVELGNSIV